MAVDGGVWPPVDGHVRESGAAGVVVAQAQASGLWPGDTYAGFYLKSNLQSLCRRCHGRKTETDKAHVGVWDDAIAKELSQAKKVWSFG